MTAAAPRDARDAQVLDAVRTVVRDHGIEETTIARVADAAGVSVGLVSHYHRSQEDLLIAAYAAAQHDILARIDQQISLAERDDARVEQMLITVLAQLLPLSPRRRDEVSLTHAFAEFADDGDAFEVHVERARAQLQQRVAAALENGTLCGEVDPDIDIDRAASETLHLVDGLAVRALADPATGRSSWATDSLADAVTALCPGECLHGSELD